MGLIAQVFPMTAIVAAAGFYLFELRRWFARAARPLLFSFAAVAGGLASAGGERLWRESRAGCGGAGGRQKAPEEHRHPGFGLAAGGSSFLQRLPPLTSPNIDRIAAQGVNFQRCLTPIASTLESLTSDVFLAVSAHARGAAHVPEPGDGGQGEP
jgi:hypothetical protein